MTQITEDYCSFETAKLLKEKGFDIPCRQAYFNGSLVDYTMYGFCDGELLNCPSQSLALKWLREVYKIILDVAFEANQGWTFYICHLITKTLSDGSTIIVDVQHSVWSEDVQQPYYKEYEQAVEAALLYVLKNLI